LLWCALNICGELTNLVQISTTLAYLTKLKSEQNSESLSGNIYSTIKTDHKNQDKEEEKYMFK